MRQVHNVNILIETDREYEPATFHELMRVLNHGAFHVSAVDGKPMLIHIKEKGFDEANG